MSNDIIPNIFEDVLASRTPSEALITLVRTVTIEHVKKESYSAILTEDSLLVKVIEDSSGWEAWIESPELPERFYKAAYFYGDSVVRINTFRKQPGSLISIH